MKTVASGRVRGGALAEHAKACKPLRRYAGELRMQLELPQSHRANVAVGVAGAKSGCAVSFQTGFRSTLLDPWSRRQAQHPFPQLIVLATIELRPDDDTAGYFIPAELRRVFR